MVSNLKNQLVRPLFVNVDLKIYSALLNYYLVYNCLKIPSVNGDKKRDPLKLETILAGDIQAFLKPESLEVNLFDLSAKKKRKEGVEKIENELSFQERKNKIEPTPLNIQIFLDNLSVYLDCTPFICSVALGELIRTGALNQNTPPSHSVSLLYLPSRVTNVEEALSNRQVIKITKRDLSRCLKRLKKAHGTFSKCDTLKSVFNSLGQEIILAGLVIQTLSPNLQLEGDLANQLNRFLFHFSKSSLKNYEKVFSASYAEQSIMNLNGLTLLGEEIDLTQVTDLLAKNALIRANQSLKKTKGKAVAKDTRSMPPSELSPKGGRELDNDRNLRRFATQKKARNISVSIVESKVGWYLANEIETGALFLPSSIHREKKKGPSSFLVFLDCFINYIKKSDSKLSQILASNDLSLFDHKAKKALRMNYKGFLPIYLSTYQPVVENRDDNDN